MNKFKVGDWVKTAAGYIKQVSGITSDSCDTLSIGNTSVGINVVFKNEIELWQPKEGEWCWFYNSTSLKREQRLARYKFANNGWYYDEYDTDWNHCEPFIGELPSFLKDNR